MAIILFILTLVFITYLIYVLVSDNAGGAGAKEVATPKPAKKPAPAAASAGVKGKAAEAVKKPAPVKKEEVAPAKAPERKSASETTSEAPSGLKNPATGEVATVPTNYRFAKRWIKEAMVSEGLLDRIYKNNELSGKNDDKVKKALDGFKSLKKYHA